MIRSFVSARVLALVASLALVTGARAVDRHEPPSLVHAAPRTPAPSETTLAVRSRVDADVPQAALDEHLFGDVAVLAHVTPWGVPDSVVALSGDARLRATALAAVRWWVFEAPEKPVWTRVSVTVDGRADVNPLHPDVLGMAAEAEHTGAWSEAVIDYCGALTRIGKHPRLRNPWSLRERIIHDVARMKVPPKIAGAPATRAAGSRGQQGHVASAAEHADLLVNIEDALLVSPWWGDAYEWAAASQLQCGRSADAVRSLLLYGAASPTPETRERVHRALLGIGRGDTLAVARMLTLEGKQFNTDADADY